MDAIKKKKANEFMNFNTVLYVTEVRRQQGVFKDILLKLRDGQMKRDDWMLLMNHCSLDRMTLGEREEFFNHECTYILSTNDACAERNKSKLKQCQMPILQIHAEHDSASSSSKSSDCFRRLPSKLYLCVNARVMLLWNISVQNGLVDGSTGTITGIHPSNLSDFIVIDFPEY